MSEPCHALVFRDVRELLCLRKACQATVKDLTAFQETQEQEHLVSALLRAGEMECGLADVFEHAAPVFTDSLAEALINPASAKAITAVLQDTLQKIPYTSTQYVSRPEGFAYYGLHPLDYADAVKGMNHSGDGLFIVIGIRTIGFTFASVVKAALRTLDGTRKVQSMSVRPTGHPYDRHCSFAEAQISTIAEDIESVRVFVVDEGPGMSGSSFLSVGESLVALGVPPLHITFLCSREVNPANLVAPNAAERWQRFNTQVVERKHFKPEDDAVQIPAGEWRKEIADEREWPGLWTTMAPSQYRSADGRYVFKYEGLGRYGDALRERTHRLAEAGYALPTTRAANGYSRRLEVMGRRLSKSDISWRVLDHVAQYLAFRVREFRCSYADVGSEQLGKMCWFNLREALGLESLDIPRLVIERPAIADGSMMPFNWLQPAFGRRLLKLDCAAHGDGHFFPGPIDIAWDIAGTIIEWELDDSSTRYFLNRYAALSGDRPHARLRPYELAYAAFRNGYCRMAASAMAAIDPKESQRLARDSRKYSERLVAFTQKDMAAAAV